MAQLCYKPDCIICRQYDELIRERKLTQLPEWVRRSLVRNMLPEEKP